MFYQTIDRRSTIETDVATGCSLQLRVMLIIRFLQSYDIIRSTLVRFKLYPFNYNKLSYHKSIIIYQSSFQTKPHS